MMAKPCNRGNMTKFVTALESGTYAQVTGALRYGDRFCCLGVACDAAIRDGVEMDVKRGSCGYSGCTICGLEERYEYQGAVSYLPPAVSEWLGIDVSNPRLAGALATWWNDTAGLEFPGIAQLFRHEYLDPDPDDDSPEWEKELEAPAAVL